MLVMVLLYFFVEMFVGFMYNSLALVADACHMLSDGLCLVIALIAIQVSKRSSHETVLKTLNTFGWVRAEVLGALVNGVFLLALCVIIILEAVQKFIEPEPVKKPLTVCIGIFIQFKLHSFGYIF
jgi:zinc transporter 1